MSTHPSAHSVVNGLPGRECSGLHHENQQVDHCAAEPVDRHETCTATYPFVTAMVRAHIEECHGLHALEAATHKHKPLSTELQRYQEGPTAGKAADMVYMHAIKAAVLTQH